MLLQFSCLAIIAILLLISIYILLKISKKISGIEVVDIKNSINLLDQNLKDTEANFKGEFATNRKENSDNAKGLREEVNNQLNAFTKTFSEQLTSLTNIVAEKFNAFQTSIDLNNKDSRKELKDNLETFKNELNTALKDFKENIRDSFSDFNKQQQTQNVVNTEKLDGLKKTLESSIKNLQDGNEKKLEEMRNTVDEKLQKTLDTQLAKSFDQVSKNLESVQKGLGEMQQLATGVGDLKKVLSNVKTRGILGELQLSNILEQLLSPEQYEINVITKKGTTNRVEFAIKIPQLNQENKVLLMPIDSKFPIEDYYSLLSAYDSGDTSSIDASGKSLETAIKKAAKDIHDKYIDPPETSEIGLLFLPVEGLYAEAVRRPSLIETLQRDFQVIITGPTTLSAILSTISFGYKTMAMEQRSGEIKRTLSAVRTEFNKFGDVLKKAKDKIDKASEDIDELVGARTRKIQSKLKSFDELPSSEVKLILETNTEVDSTEELKDDKD
jgi:DNA recombination protein RmuC